jgi:mannose-1-phosphate guanylyltransferase
MLHAAIMAGGSGTRFWPASRGALPKQLLNLAGERSMLQQTVDRLGDLVSPDRTLILTNVRLADAVGKQLPDLPKSCVICEPAKRDTAACIGLAAFCMLHADPDATMVVMPSDHVISTDEQFRSAITAAATLVQQNPQRLVTFGVSPGYPAISFGYIERGEVMAGSPSGINVHRVKQFREKPQVEIAQQYVESGNFYWNAGIFVWKAQRIADLLAEHQPAMHERLQTIAAAIGQDDYDEILNREFTAIKGTSIDYAVMEKADDVVVVETPFSWDDVGSWQALARLVEGDEHGNTVVGKHLGVATSNSIIRGQDGHLIVTLGVKDLVVVHTPDATLVANKHDEESIRQVVQQLTERGWEEYL